MKIRNFVTMMVLVVAIGAMTYWGDALGATGSSAPRVAPPSSHAYGKTLADWLTIYWQDYFGVDISQVKMGRVQLMPIPAGEWISGTCAPDDPCLFRGELEIPLPPGAPFVLPLVTLIGERYNTGLPDDQPYKEKDFLAMTQGLVLTVDGTRIIWDGNKSGFYVPETYFVPPIYYTSPTSYGSIAALYFQGVGFVSQPLPPGEHEIHLYAPLVVPDFFGYIFDNKWIVTVSPQ